MTTTHARRIAGLLREHAADLRARADRIDALAKVPADITIDDIAAELLPPRSHAFSTIARVMIDAARDAPVSVEAAPAVGAGDHVFDLSGYGDDFVGRLKRVARATAAGTGTLGGVRVEFMGRVLRVLSGDWRKVEAAIDRYWQEWRR